MKKFLWTLLFVGYVLSCSAFSPKDRLIDSLRAECETEQDAPERVALLLNLKDLTDASKDEMHYSRRLFREACDAGDGFAVGASLGSLASYCIGNGGESRDSLDLLLAEAEPLLQNSSMEGLATYYRMVWLARRIQTAPHEKSQQYCREYLDSIRTAPAGDVYQEAARLFLSGVAAYRLASAKGQMQMERGLPYWNDELALLPEMRPTARRNFHANLITSLISVYSKFRDQEALVRTADGYLAMLDAYYRDPEIVRRRPYISQEMSYLVCYYTMCTTAVLDKSTAREYYGRYSRFMQSAAADPNNILTNRQGFYSISTEYFTRQEDYETALAYNDSLIMLTRPSGPSPLLVGMYKRRARLCERMGQYREACRAYNTMTALRDSLPARDYAQKISEMEVRYGLDKVERDRALILAQKRQNTLWFIGVILLIAIVVLIFLWRNLLHIKRLQHNLRIESQRAQESDRLKSDFMGSMSHEIRTPLNAINGFAELIAEGGLSQAECAEFAQIIRDNTRLFTTLINDMLEVAQLDNTIAELPKMPMDICRIIRAETELLPPKEGVEYRMNFEVPEVIVPLHRGYMTELIRELLKNAVKFTGHGTITVDCGKPENGELTFSVSDTGCGVGAEWADRIFERFYKKDPFGQGLGLGLSLCRLIVEKLGGTIRLDAAYTQGARFVVTLKV